MSQKIITDDEWFELHEQLSTAFSAYSPNPAARAGLYYSELSPFNPETIKKAVKTIIKTHERFPTIAQLIATINQLDPPPDPVVEASKREIEEWQKAEFERKLALNAIQKLPPQQRAELEQAATNNCKPFLKWPAYKLVLQAHLIMLYREKYARRR